MGCCSSCDSGGPCGSSRDGPKLIYNEIVGRYSAEYTAPEWEMFLGGATQGIGFRIQCTDLVQDLPSGPMLYVILQVSADGVNWETTKNLVSSSMAGGSPMYTAQLDESELNIGLRHRLYVYNGSMGAHLARVKIWAQPMHKVEESHAEPVRASPDDPAALVRAALLSLDKERENLRALVQQEFAAAWALKHRRPLVEVHRVFDEMMTAGVTSYTLPEWDDLLGDYDALVIQAECETLSGTLPLLTLQLQGSSDGGRTWDAIETLVDGAAIAVSGRTVLTYKATAMAPGAVRLKVTTTGTAYEGRVRVRATISRKEDAEQPDDVLDTPAPHDIGLGKIQRYCIDHSDTCIGKSGYDLCVCLATEKFEWEACNINEGISNQTIAARLAFYLDTMKGCCASVPGSDKCTTTMCNTVPDCTGGNDGWNTECVKKAKAVRKHCVDCLQTPHAPDCIKAHFELL